MYSFLYKHLHVEWLGDMVDAFQFLRNYWESPRGPVVRRVFQVVLVVKNLAANAGDLRDAGLIPESGRRPGGGHGSPLQYSCLENPMDRGAWGLQSQRVRQNWSDYPHTTPMVKTSRSQKWWFSHSAVSNSCNSMDFSLWGFSVHGILQARILERVSFPSPGDLPDPGIEAGSPAYQVDFFLTELQGKPPKISIP